MHLDAYVRVSQVRGRSGDSFISPASQRERIEAWAKAHGHCIAKVHEELDASGATVDRPKLTEAMRRVEAGETNGIVVVKLDRFGRTLIDSLGLIERIERAGGTFASVQDGFDLATDTGRLVLRIMFSLAEWELDRIRGSWADARERAVRRGLHLTATVPFGYRRRKDNGLEAHPSKGPLVTELFARRARGEGWAELTRWLERAGARTQRGRSVWSLRAVRDIIRSDVYLGVARHGEYVNRDAHEPLTDPVTWRSAQRRGRQTRPRTAEPALLGGLLRCSGCRFVMRAKTRELADGRVVHDYRCRCDSDQTRRCLANASASGAEGIEGYIVERFFERVHLASRARAGGSLAELEGAALRARQTLEHYASDTELQTTIGYDAYRTGLEARQHELEQAQRALEAEQDADGSLALPDGETLRASWDDLAAQERRRLLGLAIDCIFVRRRVGDEPLATRLFVCWRGESPDLPAQGRRDYSPRPFVFDGPDDVGAAMAQDREPARGDSLVELAV